MLRFYHNSELSELFDSREEFRKCLNYWWKMIPEYHKVFTDQFARCVWIAFFDYVLTIEQSPTNLPIFISAIKKLELIL